MPACIDHLVIAARSLDQGVAGCEATFGVMPGPGGVHPLMGTHNRLLKIATADFPRAYLEIIAIDPGQKPARSAAFHRWFDLDDAELQATLERRGPQLVHFVAEVSDANAAVQALARLPRLLPRRPRARIAGQHAAGRRHGLPHAGARGAGGAAA